MQTNAIAKRGIQYIADEIHDTHLAVAVFGPVVWNLLLSKMSESSVLCNSLIA